MIGCAVDREISSLVQDILLMVGPYGDWVKYNLDENVELVTEIDGVLISSSVPMKCSPVRGQ